MSRNQNSEINTCFHKVLSECGVIDQFKKVIIIFKENEYVWIELKNVLEKYEVNTIMVRIPNEEKDINSWIPKRCENGLFFIEPLGFYEADLTIFGLPIEARDYIFQKRLHERFIELQTSGQPTIMIDWPPEDIESSLKELVSHLYIRALCADYSNVHTENERLKNWLNRGRAYRITTSNGTDILIKREERPIHTEDCLINKTNKSILQLPCGEVFFAPIEKASNGVLVTKVGKKKIEISIKNGVARFEDERFLKIPNESFLGEFGIGTNRSMAKLFSLSSGEKAYGTCHFGFGNNTDIGGQISTEYHYDIIIDEPTITILE
ncbi:hypothetical protein X928_08335 [Petrotoga miotherma DSM 10691]|jgi:hypothetical protein|uniref:Leucyl aminopeptidase (Aminopeptidase T)-like protein n=3 Tax=Petrotoga TaxID=28236 RepID=A9BGM5_PETMO|nr:MULTISPECIES: aminopeptidase [Petrotoga]ABX32265.1 Leucyl aminopeptidase (aminopeptidase T)-like protein [Petrotoga mobilis SJ95]PNR98993.1 hypothetical protein X928_08335 [Petrotoga miotherma DSM 10691]POZ92036.1 hypothetical protein AA81_09470 [Petrotoga halophila DSM 16923]RAO98712.1 hypothetical protein PW5551_08245 [Petrotoga sp. 9PW.55.5.1]